MPEVINVNGRLSRADEALVSPLDRGFLYGDSVYETVRTYNGRPFRMAEHLARLRRSAERLAIPIERAPVEIATEVARTVASAANEESAIRILVSRGVGPIGYDPAPVGPPTVVIYVRPCPTLPDSFLHEGVDVAIVGVTRNAASALDPAIKSSNLLNNFLAWQEAHRLGAYEPILLNGEERLAEGASSNLFLVRAGRLLTPPPEGGILLGVTRDLVIELARRDGLLCGEEPLGAADLRRADEAFLTSTLKGILPIRRCDGWPLQEGRPGVVTRRLIQLFEKEVQAETKADVPPGSILR